MRFVTREKKDMSFLREGQGRVPRAPMPSGGLTEVATMR